MSCPAGKTWTPSACFPSAGTIDNSTVSSFSKKFWGLNSSPPGYAIVFCALSPQLCVRLLSRIILWGPLTTDVILRTRRIDLLHPCRGHAVWYRHCHHQDLGWTNPKPRANSQQFLSPLLPILHSFCMAACKPLIKVLLSPSFLYRRRLCGIVPFSKRLAS